MEHGDVPGVSAQPAPGHRPARRPGLSRESFKPTQLRKDAQAGLVNAVVSVPDGLAAGALAGVNPVYGLYTSATAAIAGGMTAISSREARSIWSAGLQARLTIAVTFFATLVLSIPLAVAAGFVLSVLIYLARSGSDVRVVEVCLTEDGGLVERDEVPPHVRDGEVMALSVRGSMFFAGARALQERLPEARTSRNAVVVLRMRGHEEIGATFIDILDDYAEDLEAGGGRLYLTGLSERMARQLRLSAKLDVGETVHLSHAEPLVGAATVAAAADGRAWLRTRRDEPVEERGHELRRPQAPVLPEGALRVTERSGGSRGQD
ncbi:MAG: STAS domain-containing protein [Dermatophilaceae bacterium]|nr:hypothetical protein [Intrasporangiaceae bacterium]